MYLLCIFSARKSSPSVSFSFTAFPVDRVVVMADMVLLPPSELASLRYLRLSMTWLLGVLCETPTWVTAVQHLAIR